MQPMLKGPVTDHTFPSPKEAATHALQHWFKGPFVKATQESRMPQGFDGDICDLAAHTTATMIRALMDGEPLFGNRALSWVVGVDNFRNGYVGTMNAEISLTDLRDQTGRKTLESLFDFRDDLIRRFNKVADRFPFPCQIVIELDSGDTLEEADLNLSVLNLQFKLPPDFPLWFTFEFERSVLVNVNRVVERVVRALFLDT